MDGLEVCKLVVVGIDAHAEEEPGIATVDNLVIPELRHLLLQEDLDKARTYRRTSTKLDWYFWSLGATSLCTSPRRRT